MSLLCLPFMVPGPIQSPSALWGFGFALQSFVSLSGLGLARVDTASWVSKHLSGAWALLNRMKTAILERSSQAPTTPAQLETPHSAAPICGVLEKS